MGIFDPQPLPSSPTSQSTTTGALNPWAQPYVTNYLNAAQGLVQNQGFTPLQQQAFGGAGSLQGGQAAQTGLGAAQQGITGALGAGQAYQTAATTPAAIQAYMSPYIQSSLQPQLAEMERQYGITGTQEQSQATAAGAFGGSREALMAAENQRNKNMAMDKAIAQGYQNAFQAAQQAQQFGSTLGLQGQQAGIAGANQLTGQGTGILGLQNQLGTQQQQYPYQQLGFLQSMMQGLPVASATTQGWQSGPNKASQIAGLGTALSGGLGKLFSGSGLSGSGNAAASGVGSLWNWLTGGGGSGGSYIPNADPNLDNRDVGMGETADVAPVSPYYDVIDSSGNISTNYDVSSIPTDAWSTGDFAKGGKVKSYANGGLVTLALDKALKG